MCTAEVIKVKERNSMNATGKNAALHHLVRPSSRRGGTLRILAAGGVDSLDPARTYYLYGWSLQRILQRTLLAFAPLGSQEKLVPDLAVGHGMSSDGGRQWSYRLRRGVRFEDGTEVTSADVKYAVERSFARDTLDGGPSHLVDLLDNSQGYRGPYIDPDPAGLRSIVTPDPWNITFRLVRPFADFDYLMALPNVAPVPRARDTRRDYGLRPMASGPYRVQRYIPDRELLLVRNEAWDPCTDGVRQALPDQVQVEFGLSPSEQADRLLADEGDLCLDTSVQGDFQKRVLGDSELLARTDNPVTGIVRYISVQTQVPPFDDVRCRRAVHYAMDRSALHMARGGADVGGDLAFSMVPPTLTANSYKGERDEALRHAQPERARAELASAGYPRGFDTVIATVRQGKALLVAEKLRESLAVVGIRAQVRPLDQGTYFSEHLGVPERVRAEGLGLAVVAWGADFPSEYGFFRPIVDGRCIRAQGNQNYAELNDPAINSLIDATQATTDSVQKAQLWHQVEQKVTESATLLPFVHDRSLWYRNPRLTSVGVLQALGVYDLARVGVR
jgi:peptide/nickel transport system substrate-binding protein